MVLDELLLDGAIRPIRGILPFAVAARDHGFEQLILPKANEAEAAVVEEVRRVPVSTLDEVVRYLQGQEEIQPTAYNPRRLFEDKEGLPRRFPGRQGTGACQKGA